MLGCYTPLVQSERGNAKHRGLSRVVFKTSANSAARQGVHGGTYFPRLFGIRTPEHVLFYIRMWLGGLGAMRVVLATYLGRSRLWYGGPCRLSL